MDSAVASVVRDTAAASNEGRMHFGQVVGALLEAGIESYSVDYRARRTTYYVPTGETLTVDHPGMDVAIGQDFSAEGIKAAILGAQRGELMYPQFKHLSQLAGCIGYTVWLTGRHVSYFGRHGEVHIEPFPN